MRIYRKIVLISIILVLGILLAGAYFFTHKPIKEGHTEIDYIMFEDTKQLEDRADVILIGKPLRDFCEDKSVVINQGRDFYTISEVSVQKVFKGTYPKDTIQIKQPAALTDSPWFDVDFFHRLLIIDGDNYTVMKKGLSYVLFLYKADIPDLFALLVFEQGKYNCDGLDTKEAEMAKRNQQYSKLKNIILQRYKR